MAQGKTTEEFIYEHGRTLMERDSYGILTEYTYDNEVYGDNYGLLLRKKAYASRKNGNLFEINDSAYLLLEEHKYDANSEYTEATTNGITSQGFIYQKRHSQLESVTTGNGTDFGNMQMTGSNVTGVNDGLTTKFGYNNFRDQLLKVSQTDGRTTRSNVLTYENGALRTVTDGNVKFGVINDIISDTVDFTVFDGSTETSMLTKSTEPYRSEGGTSSTIAEYHNEANKTTGRSEVRLDRYGRLKKNEYTDESGSGYASYTYQPGNGESEAAGKLATIKDTYEGKRYEYRYDYNNALVGWSIREGVEEDGDNYLSVR